MTDDVDDYDDEDYSPARWPEIIHDLALVAMLLAFFAFVVWVNH